MVFKYKLLIADCKIAGRRLVAAGKELGRKGCKSMTDSSVIAPGRKSLLGGSSSNSSSPTASPVPKATSIRNQNGSDAYAKENGNSTSIEKSPKKRVSFAATSVSEIEEIIEDPPAVPERKESAKSKANGLPPSALAKKKTSNGNQGGDQSLKSGDNKETSVTTPPSKKQPLVLEKETSQDKSSGSSASSGINKEVLQPKSDSSVPEMKKEKSAQSVTATKEIPSKDSSPDQTSGQPGTPTPKQKESSQDQPKGTPEAVKEKEISQDKPSVPPPAVSVTKETSSADTKSGSQPSEAAAEGKKDVPAEDRTSGSQPQAAAPEGKKDIAAVGKKDSSAEDGKIGSGSSQSKAGVPAAAVAADKGGPEAKPSKTPPPSAPTKEAKPENSDSQPKPIKPTTASVAVPKESPQSGAPVAAPAPKQDTAPRKPREEPKAAVPIKVSSRPIPIDSEYLDNEEPAPLTLKADNPLSYMEIFVATAFCFFFPLLFLEFHPAFVAAVVISMVVTFTHTGSDDSKIKSKGAKSM